MNLPESSPKKNYVIIPMTVICSLNIEQNISSNYESLY